jgi:hypothetical protein
MPFAHHGERLRGHGAVGRQVVRAVHVDRIDLGVVGELDQVDDARGLDADLLDVLVVDDDVATLLEFVAFHELRVGNVTLAVRAPALLLDARLALAMELVEGNGRGRLGGREHLHRDVDETYFQEPFPRRSRCHMRNSIV